MLDEVEALVLAADLLFEAHRDLIEALGEARGFDVDSKFVLVVADRG